MRLGIKNEYQLEIEVTSADITNLLNQLYNAGITLYHINYITDLSIRLKILKKDYQNVKKITSKLGSTIKCIRSIGLPYFFEMILRRPVLCVFFLIITTFIITVPNRIFFVYVEGNEIIPTNKIIEVAEKNGIRFGSLRRDVRSEKIKNLILENIPELRWIGINTSGCTAVISVKEKTAQENNNNNLKQTVCSIVASHDGIIQRYTVLNGNPLLEVGQAVMKGQVLVSGYTDCGIITKATHANAEIFALTFREINVVALKPTYVRNELLEKKVRYSIRVGKNIINLYKDSGILDTTCGKIYVEDFWELPGGFRFPISIIKETTVVYSEAQNALTIANHASWIKDFAIGYIEDQMVSGEVISSKIAIDQTNAVTYLRGRYACSEMIAQIKLEDSIQKDEDNGREGN